MTSSADTQRKPVAPQCLAEAGVWIARLHGDSRGRAMENGLVLEDGTRVFLNTDTRIVVKYDKETRRVELKRGEAR